MKHLVLSVILFAVTGCADYQDARLQLINQARQGVAMLSRAKSAEVARGDALDRLQRKGLDEAFDRDVRQREELSPDWVIEHRKAYAAGLDALHTQRSATRATIEANARNLQAVDAALQSLQRIMQAEGQLLGEGK